MNKDTTKRTSTDRRNINRRQDAIPIKVERRGQIERRTGVDRRLKRA